MPSLSPIFFFGATIILAYLLGAIPVGLLLGKYFKGIDIRQIGSGKTGATNVYRALGLRAAIAALLGDTLKGVAGVLIARLLLGSVGDWLPYGEMAGAMAAVSGHNWPVYIGWRGGRGVATALGAAITLAPIAAAVALPVAIALIIASDMASVGSLGGVLVWLMAFGVLSITGHQTPVYAIFALIASALLVIQHRDNIGRLRRGEERKLGLRARIQRKADSPVT